MKIYDGRKFFYQWDLNQKLTSDTLEVGDEVHYSNLNQTEALVTVAYELDGKVVSDIPNILLQDARLLRVDRYIKTDNSEYTIKQYSFNVKPKTKPSDYVYTETETLNYHTLLTRVEKLESGSGIPEAKSPNLWELDSGIYHLTDNFFYTNEDIMFCQDGYVVITVKNNRRNFRVFTDDAKLYYGYSEPHNINTDNGVQTIVNGKIEVPNLTGYATTDYVDNAITAAIPPSAEEVEY